MYVEQAKALMRIMVVEETTLRKGKGKSIKKSIKLNFQGNKLFVI